MVKAVLICKPIVLVGYKDSPPNCPMPLVNIFEEDLQWIAPLIEREV